MLTLSAIGLALIASFEGFRDTPYNDPAHNCTVGYGHLIHTGRCDGRISEQRFKRGLTREEAFTLLAQDAKTAEAAVHRLVMVPLNQNQFDALASFTFNVGAGAFARSDLLRMLNAGDYSAVPAQMALWRKGGGQTLPGLVRRRAAEAALFTKPMNEDLMTYYRQRDPAWARVILGNNAPASRYTIGSDGCVITSLAPLCGVTPLEMNTAGIARACFRPGDGIARTFEPAAWVPGTRWKLVGASGAYPNSDFPVNDYARACDRLEAGGRVMFWLQYPPRKTKHYALGVASMRKSSGRVIILADPERDGPIEELTRFYGPWPTAIVQAWHYAKGGA